MVKVGILIKQKRLKMKDKKDNFWIVAERESTIIKLIEDLYWDYDRMSNSGKETLDKIMNLISPENTKVIYWEGKEPPTLEEAQKIVGGNIELVSNHYHKIKDADIIVNEEGLITGLDLNVAAFKICKIPLMVNVVVLKGKQMLK